MIPKGKKIYLCTPDLQPITVLNGVKTDTVNYDTHLKDYDELTFEIDRYILVNGELVESNGYELVDVYLNLYLEDIGNFQMQYPIMSNDGQKETKTITAYSIEKEFENKDWKGFKVNTGETDSLEQLAEDNLDDLGFAKEFIIFYNPDRKDLSLLHLILEKMPGWSVIDDDIDPLLWEKKISISEDNTNLYALLTSIIAPKVECIFMFDTINKRIKAIGKDRLNDYIFDTNIFISQRNLANSIDVTTDEDTVFTRFECRGDGDLTVNDYNYNESKIFDLSYFLREPYMPESLVEKVKNWVQWRDDNRESFADLSKQSADINEKIYEIQYRVPNDGDNWEQWDDMKEDELRENLDYYNALLTSLQVSVDSDPQYDSKGNYIPWKNSDGTINHDRYLALLYNQSNGYGGYYTYYEILNYIIPNIEIAIDNLDVPSDEKKDYITDYETNWELYGIEELKAKQKDYENRLDALKKYEKDWSELTEEEQSEHLSEEAYNTLGHDEYVEITEYLGSEDTEGSLLFYLKKLTDKKAELENELETVNANRVQMVEQAQITHPSYGFTNSEIILITTLFYDTDYTNSNIITTSLDTTLTNIDREKELYEDSVSKLSEVCQPQISFSTNVDNLLNLPEFEKWKGDFELLNFIRLGIRDDFSVKLRLIGYSYNPCDINSDLRVEFSNMITSRSGRSDLTDILNNENNRAAKNNISIGIGNSESDKAYMTALLQAMIKTGIFKNAVSNIAGGTTAKLDEAEIGTLVSKYIKAERIDADQINVDQGSFNRVFAKYIDADVIVGNSASFKTLETDVANIENAIMGVSSTETGIVFNLNSENAKLDEAFIRNGIAAHMSIADLQAGNIILNDNMQILSENGKLIMNGTALQILGTDSEGNEYVGIQLGYDTTDNPSLILRNEEGATILTPNGITQDAIADGLIINNMLGDNSVSKRNIDWTDISEGVDENGNPIWNISNIYINGEQFGAQYTTFTEATENHFADVEKEMVNLSDSIDSVSLIVDKNEKAIEQKAWQTDINNTINNLNVGGEELFNYIELMSYNNGSLNNATNISISGSTISVTGNPNIVPGVKIDVSKLKNLADNKAELVVYGYFDREDDEESKYENVYIYYTCFNSSDEQIQANTAKALSFSEGDALFCQILSIPAESSYIHLGIGQIYSKPYTLDAVSVKDAAIYDITREIRDRLAQIYIDKEQIKMQVSDVQSSVDDNIQDLNSKISTLEQNAEGFKQTVEKTYVSKDNLDVSSRNLLRNSKTLIFESYGLSEEFLLNDEGVLLSSDTEIDDEGVLYFTKVNRIVDENGILQ